MWFRMGFFRWLKSEWDVAHIARLQEDRAEIIAYHDKLKKKNELSHNQRNILKIKLLMDMLVKIDRKLAKYGIE